MFNEGKIAYRFITRGTEKLQQYLEQRQFDAVICTHVISALFMTEVRRKSLANIPSFFVATDYTCSPMVANSNLDLYFVPSTNLIEEFVQCGVPADRIIASGIPVRKIFLTKTLREVAKNQLHIPSKSKHLLVMCGSMGCGPMRKLVAALDKKLYFNTTITVICGTNNRLYKFFSKKYQGNDRVRIMSYTSNVSLLMDSADLFLTKPGGLSVTEARAKMLPMVFINAVAGCEDHNLRYFVANGMAASGESVRCVTELCAEILNCDEKRALMSQKMRMACPRNATEQIYRSVDQYAQISWERSFDEVNQL